MTVVDYRNVLFCETTGQSKDNSLYSEQNVHPPK